MENEIKTQQKNKLDHDKILLMLKSGLTTKEIADITGYNYKSVYSVTSEQDQMQSVIKDYRTNRADVLALLHLKSNEVLNKIFDKLLEAGEIDKLKPREIADILKALSIASSKHYEQERLEQGKATGIQGLWGLVVSASDSKITERFAAMPPIHVDDLNK